MSDDVEVGEEVRAYCAKYSLMEPKIVGELTKEQTEMMREMLFECALNP